MQQATSSWWSTNVTVGTSASGHSSDMWTEDLQSHRQLRCHPLLFCEDNASFPVLSQANAYSSFKRQNKISLKESFLNGPTPATHTPPLGSLSTCAYTILELTTLDSAPEMSSSWASWRTLEEQATFFFFFKSLTPSDALQLLEE